VDNKTIFEHMQMHTTASKYEIGWMNLVTKYPFLPYYRAFSEFELGEYMYRCSTSFIRAPDLTSWRTQDPLKLKQHAEAEGRVVPMESSWGNVDFGKISLGIDSDTYQALVQPYLVNKYELTYLMYHFPKLDMHVFSR
jgi:hypothetical protein